MKTFLGVIASLAVATALAMAGCSSNDDATTAVTNPGNVATGSACTQGSQCQSGVCGFPMAATCKATGVCIVQSTCAVRTLCPCGGGPAFSECDDGVNAGEPVTGSSSCIAEDDGGGAADGGDGSADAGDAGDAGDASPVTDGAISDASDGAISDAGTDSASDAADASDSSAD